MQNHIELGQNSDEDGSHTRKDESHEKNYLIGKYGAIPTLKSIDIFKEEQHGEKGQKYSKADEQIYRKLCKVGNEEKAIQIAQQKLEQCIREGKTKPSEMCPCTMMHELVGEIRSGTEPAD